MAGLAIRALLIAAAASLLIVAASPALAQVASEGPLTVPAGEIIRRAKAGEAINFSDATVEGNIDLRSVGGIARPIRCVACRFRGSITAVDVIFERAVDLSESTVAGSVDLTGSVFKDQVTFDKVVFEGPFLAASTLLTGVSFANARFQAPAVFDQARLKGQVRFAASTFDQDADFRGTEFESKVNFARTTFEGGHFESAIFGSHASFSAVAFGREANFDGAEFSGGGNFRVAEFRGAAMFNRINAGKDLSFDAAVLMGSGSFQNIIGSGLFSLSGLRLVGEAQLFVSEVASREFSMDVDQIVNYARGGKKDLLAQLEQSAQARNDLPVANQARFARLSLAGKTKDGLEGFADRVYRNVLGYFVRPSRPLVAFGVLVFAAGLARVLPDMAKFVGRAAHRLRHRALEVAVGGGTQGEMPTSETPPRPGVRAKANAFRLRVTRFLHPLVRACDGWAASLKSAFGKKPPGAAQEKRDGPGYAHAVVLWMEFLLYKALIAVFLLSLSNSNPTAREIFYNVWSS